MSETKNISLTLGKKSITLVLGDLTEIAADAIVNAANEYLSHGGGVAGAISRKGGPDIQRESDEWIQKNGLVQTGSAAVTGAGNLKAKYVIHAVGPVMGSGDEDAKLLSAVQKSLELAESLKIKTIYFPAISTGIFGYPVDRCAKIMISAAKSHLRQSSLDTIGFCLWDEKSYNIFRNELK